MARLEFSVAERNPNALDFLKATLSSFQRDHPIQVQLATFTWDKMWSELRRMVIHRQGPDVSEVGSTWLGSFVGMSGVLALDEEDIVPVGGNSLFIPAARQNVSLADDERMWAAPWLADCRVIFYWRDMLERARIDPDNAFQTPEQVEQTLQRLQASGIRTPWAVATDRVPNTLHQVASWVWAKGGDFVSADGRTTLFNQPEALAAIRAYFNLYRYMPSEPQPLLEAQVMGMFARREVAVTMSGPWWPVTIANQGVLPSMMGRLGASLPPGPPFVGGSNLVLWEHMPGELHRPALSLIRHLLSARVQTDFCAITGLLPVRLDVLAGPPYATDPLYRVFSDALREGRSLWTIPLSGTVEETLTAALAQIWTEIGEQENPDVDAITRQYLERLALRLDATLGA